METINLIRRMTPPRVLQKMAAITLSIPTSERITALPDMPR
jgi:hypothetical protein